MGYKAMLNIYFLIRRHRCFFVAVAATSFCLTAHAQSPETQATGIQAEANRLEACLLASIQTATADTTIGTLRSDCKRSVTKATQSEPQSLPDERLTLMEERILVDQMNFNRSYVISAFQPNYFMATYSGNPNEEPFSSLSSGEDILDNGEAKFQVSIKAPIWRNIFSTNNDLMVAYTSTSWWQIDNDEISSAFRETNYQPEAFLRHYGGPKLLGGRILGWDIGLNHQSNGRSQLLSRSWNRIMGRLYMDYGDVAIGLRAWYRIPEDEDEDDNPHMHRYYGYGDVRIAYAPNRNTFTAMLRPGTEENGLELTWSYPLTSALRVYAEYWNGYGESLLDYDARIERIGIGIALNDWLENR